MALQEATAVAFLALTLASWFGGVPPPPWAPLLALGFGAAWAVRFGPAVLSAFRAGAFRPHGETVACLGLALLYRGPALLHPWGFVNKDGAFPAFIALHLLEGVRPAPVFTEGANYQGSLKGHLAALLSALGAGRDLSGLVLLASTLLYLVFVAASMALARRIAGRGAALVTGLYLAFSPKFLTTFSLNAVGQYVDVLALGGVALALVGALDRQPRALDRPTGFAIGLLLGAAFWQQPVALVYLGAALGGVVFCRESRLSRAGVLSVPVGLAVGALPVLIWNLQNGWASGDILGRPPQEILAQVEAVPTLVARTATQAFPILTGLSPGHPAAPFAAARMFAAALLPLVTVLYGATQWPRLRDAVRGGPQAPLLPLLLVAANLALFWATASGSINKRPRYLLPLLAAFAIMFGATAAWGLARARLPTLALVVAILALNAAGTWPRLRESASVEAFWRRAVDSLDERSIRTGYADFGVAGPVTMFTAERITLSARLGPTPAYYSDRQDEKVAREGPDAYVLARGDDPEAFARALSGLGVTCRFAPRPFPTFWDCSRRVRLEEVAGFRGDAVPALVPEEP